MLEGARAVGEDEVGVEVDGVAEALAARAGAVGIVEGEEARLGLAVGAVAGGALECGGKAEVLGGARNNRRSFDCGGCAASAQDDSFIINGLAAQDDRFWGSGDDSFIVEGLGVAGEGVELDFAGLAVAGLDSIDDAGADAGREGKAVDENEDGLGEVEREEGLGGGELDDSACCAGVG